MTLNKKKIWFLLFPSLGVALICILATLQINRKTFYREFQSPDKKFSLLVYGKSSLNVFPGHGGDLPGVVVLLKNGHVVKTCNVEMVQLVDNPVWKSDNVYIKFVLDWTLM